MQAFSLGFILKNMVLRSISSVCCWGVVRIEYSPSLLSKIPQYTMPWIIWFVSLSRPETQAVKTRPFVFKKSFASF